MIKPIDFSEIVVRLDHIVIVGLILVSAFWFAWNRKYADVKRKFDELQEPQNMKLLEEQFKQANESTKAAINLAGTAIALLHQSIPTVERFIQVPDDLENVIKEVHETLDELRDGVPVESK